MAELSKEYEGKAKVLACDADKNMETAATHGITGLPTFIYFKGGKEVNRLVGAVPKQRLTEALKALL